MSVSIQRLSPAEFALIIGRLVDIHIEAMGYDFSAKENRIDSWRRDIMNPGFTAIIASGPNDVIGMAYGFLASPHHWWDRQLRRGLSEQSVDQELQHKIHKGYFEIAEIHVRPFAQCRGIGRDLLNALLWNAPSELALLSTPEVPGESSPAFGLYRSFGFYDVLRDFYYPGDHRPFAILGCDLPTTSTD